MPADPADSGAGEDGTEGADGAGVPAAPPEEGAPGDQEGNTGPEVSQPEDGGDASGDNAVQGTDGTPAPEGGQSAPDGPTFDGLIIPVPSPTLTPEPTEEPAPTDEPKATEQPAPTQEPEAAPSAGTPFAEGMLAFGSEEEALAYLWSLEGGEYGIMPIGEISDKVDPGYFRFAIYATNEASVQNEYADFNALQTNNDNYTVTTSAWNGPDGGDLRVTGSEALATYPQIEGYMISSIRVNGTKIYHLGKYEVNGKTYVHFTAIDTQGRMTTVVLTSDTYATAPFEVRYVPEEFKIKCEVYVDGVERTDAEGDFSADSVFGQRRPTETVDQWFGTDVTIPLGYTAQVYIGNTDGFTTNGTEKFPTEDGYGNYPLGTDVVYHRLTSDERTIEINKDADAPDFFALTGTYVSGEAYTAKADQTVRVVMTKRDTTVNNVLNDDISFNANLWLQSTEVQKTGSAADNVPRVTNRNQQVTQTIDPATGGKTFVWTFTTQPVWNTSYMELRSLSINGKSLNIPYVSAAGTASAESTLPSGAGVNISVTATGNGNALTRTYTVTITGALRDVVVTGGSLNSTVNYTEVVIEQLLGVDLQMWKTQNYVEGNFNQYNYAWTTVHEGTSLRTTDANWADFMYDQTGTAGDNSGNIRFKLQEGYEWSENDVSKGIQFEEKLGSDQQSFTGNEAITGPDADGWYYTTLTNLGDIGVLNIQAQAMQYLLVYQDGNTADTEGYALNKPTEIDAGAISGMPKFTNGGVLGGTLEETSIDANHGDYYSISSEFGAYGGMDSHNSIVIPGASLTYTAERAPEFEGWVVTDRAGNALKKVTNENGDIVITNETTTNTDEYYFLAPGDEVNLQSISGGAVLYDDVNRNYAIFLTARWSEPADPFTYFVTFNYTDETGGTHERVDATVTRANDQKDSPQQFAAGDGNGFGAGPGQYYVARRDSYFDMTGLDGLSVVFDPDTVQSVAVPGVDWRWYKYDDRANTQNGSAGDIYKWSPVDNGGEVDVWFISTLGQLTISKTVNDAFTGVEDPADGVDFEFTVEFTLPETNDPGTDGDESHYFGDGSGGYAVSYTMSGAGAPTGPQTMVLTQDGNKYTGTLTLKGGQNAVFDLPAGTVYTVTETPLDNWTVASQNPTGTIAAATPTEAAFTNTPTGVVVTKEQAEIPGAVNGSGGTAPTDDAFTTELLRIGGRSTVQYKITVWNYNVAGGTFTVTDKVPEADVQPGDSGDHRKPMVIKEGPYGISLTNGVQGTLTDPEAGQGPQEGLEVGGTVKWENVPIAQGASATFTFSVVYPIVLHTHTFTNTADVAWNTTQTAQSNSVDVRVYEDWLRIGKVACDPNGELFAPDQTFHFTLTLTQGTAGAAPENEYNYTYRLAEGYSAGDVVVPEESEGHGFTLTGDGNGHFGFDLKAGQAITIFGLAPGIQYTVTEDSVAHYTSSGIQARPGTVLENNWGTISATSDDWIYFANTYEPEAATVAAPAVTKTLTGRALQAGEFAFTMTAEPAAGVTLPANAANATNDADGKVTFGDITFTSAGTYTVTIREVRGSDTHVSYDAHAYTVTYTVTDNNGILTAAQGAATGASAFANTYTPNAVTAAAPAVTKTLTGRALQAGEFTFEMTAEPAAGVTLPANAANDADGKVAFGDITFTSAGTYTITVREVNNGLPGVTYDGHAYTMTYTVTDDGGTLVAVPGTATGASAFANTYEPNAVTAAAPAVTKTLTGRALQAGEFEFEMTADPATGVTLPANATNDADGKVIFNDITFTSAGTYNVTIREVRGSDTHVSYDAHAYTVTYTVTDNNGTLVAVPGAATGASAFANTYTPNAVTAAAPAVTKTLTGRALQAGEFTFEMTAEPAEGVTLPANAANDADGKVAFGDITFTSAGTYTLTIREVKGADANVTYDEHAYTVTYTVTDDGGELVAVPGAATGESAFANTYSAPAETPPPTAEPTATPAPTDAPAATAAPTAEPAATAAPTAEPAATTAPTDAPAATAAPTDAGANDVPKTGDENEPALWAAMAAGCMLTLAGILILRRRKDRN